MHSAGVLLIQSIISTFHRLLGQLAFLGLLYYPVDVQKCTCMYSTEVLPCDHAANCVAVFASWQWLQIHRLRRPRSTQINCFCDLSGWFAVYVCSMSSRRLSTCQWRWLWRSLIRLFHCRPQPKYLFNCYFDPVSVHTHLRYYRVTCNVLMFPTVDEYVKYTINLIEEKFDLYRFRLVTAIRLRHLVEPSQSDRAWHE